MWTARFPPMIAPKPCHRNTYAFTFSLDFILLKNDSFPTYYGPHLSMPHCHHSADSAAVPTVPPFYAPNTFEMAARWKQTFLQVKIQIINDVDPRLKQTTVTEKLELSRRIVTLYLKTGYQSWGSRKMVDFWRSRLGFEQLATQK